MLSEVGKFFNGLVEMAFVVVVVVVEALLVPSNSWKGCC